MDETNTTDTTEPAAHVLITGNTYPAREDLRRMGGVWDKAAKGWRIPADKADEARALVRGAKASHRRTGYTSNVTRFSGGATIYTNKRGRCIDAPCCGCCS